MSGVPQGVLGKSGRLHAPVQGAGIAAQSREAAARSAAQGQNQREPKTSRKVNRHQNLSYIFGHLWLFCSVRVVQKNLVFVVGLPMRLADAEVLKRHEYFGKFGKIHKVVINQSTTYAGPQGPSASKY